MMGWDLIMRVGPDANRERTTLLPEEISKLGFSLRFYTAFICIGWRRGDEDYFKKSSLIESGVENAAKCCEGLYSSGWGGRTNNLSPRKAVCRAPVVAVVLLSEVGGGGVTIRKYSSSFCRRRQLALKQSSTVDLNKWIYKAIRKKQWKKYFSI